MASSSTAAVAEAESSNNDKKKKIVLRSSDGEVFEVSKAEADLSVTIKNMIEDDCAEDAIPLPNVTSKVLAKVIEHCKRHVDADADVNKKITDEVEEKEYKDMVTADQGMLFDLILAANYLNIKSLLDLTCHVVADEIKGKEANTIRKTFHIKNDFTPEEEEEVRTENQWAFE